MMVIGYDGKSFKFYLEKLRMTMTIQSNGDLMKSKLKFNPNPTAFSL